MILKRFSKDSRGAIAIKFAIMLPLFVFAVGAAIEYSRAHAARSKIQHAIDSATLSATRMLALEPSVSDSELSALIAAQLEASEVEGDAYISCAVSQTQIDRVEIRVTASVTCDFGTIFPVGMDDFEISRSAASDMSFDALDVAFMIDVSGSMSGQRLRDLKEALREAIDIFLNNSNSDVRIAFAPYSTSLDAGDYAEAASGTKTYVTSWWGGTTEITCVTERRHSNGGNGYNDQPPSVQYVKRRASWCNPAPIVPLTDNEGTLNSAINGFNASGMTAGHLGIAWSWYLISPKWRSFWPASSRPLEDGEGRKAIVIMTDGMFNARYESSNGNSTAQASRLCDEIRDAGVLVFSVGFQAPSSVKGTLRDCATTPSYFFDSGSGDELISAYKAIAEELTTHNLVQ